MDKSESARKAAATILDIVFASGIFIGPANMSKQNDILTSLASIIEGHQLSNYTHEQQKEISKWQIQRQAVDALVEAVKPFYKLSISKNESHTEYVDRVAKLYSAETSKVMPGKDVPAAAPEMSSTYEEYKEWLEQKRNAVRTALAAVEKTQGE